jgi:hypothetical protein
MSTEPAALLADMGTLRRRTRRDAHGYWLPLLLFGVPILAAALVYGCTVGPLVLDTPTLVPPALHLGSLVVQPLMLFSSFSITDSPLAIGLYWLGVIVVGTLATLGWYRWRAHRIGVQLRTGTYLLYALGALVVCVVLVPLTANWTLFVPFGGFGAPGVWGSSAAFLVGVGIALLFRRTRHVWARLGFALGVVITMVAFGNLVILSSTHGFGALLVIAAALLGLAWMERSPRCGTVAVLFTGASLLANLYDMENLLPYTNNLAWVTFDNLLLPGLVLVVGGIVALVADRRAASREIRQ